MAENEKTILDLDAAAELDASEDFEIVQDDLSKKASGAQLSRMPAGVNDQTNTTYTLVITDEIVRCANALGISVTVPPNSGVAFKIGRSVTIEQKGVGQVTFVAGAGVTINTPETLKLAKQFAVATLIKVGTNEWTLAGYLEAV